MFGSRKLLIAALVAVLPATGAFAADAGGYQIPQAAPESFPVYDDASFNWEGFYGGAFGAFQRGAPGDQWGGGVVVGANIQNDFYLLGAEAALLGLTSNVSSNVYGQLLGRGGLVLTDPVLVYGAVGVGSDFAAVTNTNLLVGGGAEFAVTDSMSLRAQYLYGIPLTNTSTQVNQFTLGANFHF